VILATVVVAAAPLVIRWTLVLASGLAALFTPLSLALNSYNTARWHMTAVPLDFAVLGLGAAAIMLFILAGRRDAVVLLSVFLVCFGTMFHGPALRPNRYWIYLTPVLAIVLAGALERLWETVDARGSRRWWRVGIVAVGGLLVLSNICAIRLEVWRHRLTDVFLALDYVRAAELIRSDLLASDIGVDRAICVTGLESPPYDASWREIVQYPRSFREHNAPVILAQAAGRRDTSRIRLDCASATSDEPGYTASASALTRNGRSVDRFASAYTRIRDLVRAGHFEQARAMAEAPGARPFCARFLLGHMRDEDVEWATNGVSVFEWADRLVANHDNWSGSPDPKVRLLKAMLESEMAGYVRLVFVREYLRARAAPPTELREVRLGVAAHRLRFRMATMTEIAVLVRSDPFLAADPAMMTFLDNLVAVSPVWRPTRDRMDFGSLRWATTLPFYDFLGRLLLSGWVGWVPGAIEDAT